MRRFAPLMIAVAAALTVPTNAQAQSQVGFAMSGLSFVKDVLELAGGLNGAAAASFARSGKYHTSDPEGITEKEITKGVFPVKQKPGATSQTAQSVASRRTDAGHLNKLKVISESKWENVYNGNVSIDDVEWPDESETLYGWGYAKGDQEYVIKCRQNTGCAKDELPTLPLQIDVYELKLHQSKKAAGVRESIYVTVEFKDPVTQEVTTQNLFELHASLYSPSQEAVHLTGDTTDSFIFGKTRNNDGGVMFTLNKPVRVVKNIRIPFGIPSKGISFKISGKSIIDYRLLDNKGKA